LRIPLASPRRDGVGEQPVQLLQGHRRHLVLSEVLADQNRVHPSCTDKPNARARPSAFFDVSSNTRPLLQHRGFLPLA